LNRGGSAISVHEREVLLLRAQKGDAKAIDSLFESCRRQLYFQALRILARPQDAEDAVQDAMLSAFTHLRRFQRRADFLSWATRIVINAALQQIRRTRTKPTVPLGQVDHEFDEASFSEYLKDPQPTPEEQLQRLQHQQMLDDAVQKLPVEIRRAIELCKYSDYPLKEAARMLGLEASTLKARLYRGRRALILDVKREAQARREPSANKRSPQPCLSSKASFARRERPEYE